MKQAVVDVTGRIRERNRELRGDYLKRRGLALPEVFPPLRRAALRC